jgi:hypothetical protein
MSEQIKRIKEIIEIFKKNNNGDNETLLLVSNNVFVNRFTVTNIEPDIIAIDGFNKNDEPVLIIQNINTVDIALINKKKVNKDNLWKL